VPDSQEESTKRKKVNSVSSNVRGKYLSKKRKAMPKKNHKCKKSASSIHKIKT
jgi:hypothetical protein